MLVDSEVYATSPGSSRVEGDADSVLRAVVAATAATTGPDFFRQLVRQLADVLRVRYAFVSEFCGNSRSRVRTLAFWFKEEFIENIEYDLAHTPCEAVLAGEVRCYPRDVATMFPRERELVEMGAESYLAIPLKAGSGNVVGHLAVIDDQPMTPHQRDMAVFQLFGVRAGSELERLRAEQALREREARLATVLATTLDAVLLVDSDAIILFCNRAAEVILGCLASQAIGRSLHEFSAASLERFLRTQISQASSEQETQRIWMTEGLHAKRCNGEEFPVEGSLASHWDGTRRLYTLVLRDVSERQRAEESQRRLERERDYLKEEVHRSRANGDLITSSPSMKALFEQLTKVAQTDATVLILGETGTGKELIARSVHHQSQRASGSLVTLNCGALPAELVESELFGHEKGAFTGAGARRLGRFELADGGTLFLDEVGELSAAAQAKLLRVLQEREFERVGGSKTVRVDVRVVAATHRSLQQLVARGEFRQDLYYRLAVFPLELPPLRERSEDVAKLAEHFVRIYARKLGRSVDGIAPQSVRQLQSYAWPGNVRELQNVIERAVILHSQGPLVVSVGSLSSAVSSVPTAPPLSGPRSVEHTSVERRTAEPRSLEAVERDHLLSTLEQTRWVIEGSSGAAKVLGLKPSTLRFRMRKLGIVKPS